MRSRLIAMHNLSIVTMANQNLAVSKAKKYDEFYTKYTDIQIEINAYLDFNPDLFRDKTVLLPCDDPEWSNFTKFFAQNFELLGLKKLISTSYAVDSKKVKDWKPTLFETKSPLFDADKSKTHGRIFILDEDVNGDGRFNIEDLKWTYLEGDGDFRSDEVKALRDEADIIVTNPPFSLFREFLAWIIEANKQFIIIGNENSISCKGIFPLLKENKIWMGVANGAKTYIKPQGGFGKMGNTCWFTNIDHGRRHQPLQLMTMAENFKHSKHKEIRGRTEYIHYDNYDAIHIPCIDAIPSDYEGIMGVPLSFLGSYCPEQFEILGITKTWYGMANKKYPKQIQHSKDGKSSVVTKLNDGAVIIIDKPLKDKTYYQIDNTLYRQVFPRILIKKKQ